MEDSRVEAELSEEQFEAWLDELSKRRSRRRRPESSNELAERLLRKAFEGVDA